MATACKYIARSKQNIWRTGFGQTCLPHEQKPISTPPLLASYMYTYELMLVLVAANGKCPPSEIDSVQLLQAKQAVMIWAEVVICSPSFVLSLSFSVFFFVFSVFSFCENKPRSSKTALIALPYLVSLAGRKRFFASPSPDLPCHDLQAPQCTPV